jgi:hypothetical protein
MMMRALTAIIISQDMFDIKNLAHMGQAFLSARQYSSLKMKANPNRVWA